MLRVDVPDEGIISVRLEMIVRERGDYDEPLVRSDHNSAERELAAEREVAAADSAEEIEAGGSSKGEIDVEGCRGVEKTVCVSCPFNN